MKNKPIDCLLLELRTRVRETWDAFTPEQKKARARRRWVTPCTAEELEAVENYFLSDLKHLPWVNPELNEAGYRNILYAGSWLAPGRDEAAEAQAVLDAWAAEV